MKLSYIFEASSPILQPFKRNMQHFMRRTYILLQIFPGSPSAGRPPIYGLCRRRRSRRCAACRSTKQCMSPANGFVFAFVAAVQRRQASATRNTCLNESLLHIFCLFSICQLSNLLLLTVFVSAFVAFAAS